jgi:hypothetical protein
MCTLSSIPHFIPLLVILAVGAFAAGWHYGWLAHIRASSKN